MVYLDSEAIAAVATVADLYPLKEEVLELDPALAGTVQREDFVAH